MCAMEKVISCQLSFIPIGDMDYLNHIKIVLDIVKESNLDYIIGEMSTYIKGESEKVFELIQNIFTKMSNIVSFTMDIKLSNICGCKN